jgi:O-acetyl-ADP-ribose deacetylase (regulator of RNase III)
VGQGTLEIVRGSVLDQNVDVIVNAANERMRGGGGIDGAIHRAAGSRLLEELRRVAPQGCPIGGVVVTQGHELKQKHIVHTPGPIWRGGHQNEGALLASAYSKCLEAAATLSASSIGLPSLSTGSHGYPIEFAAPIALDQARRFLQDNLGRSLRRIVFAMFGQAEYLAFVGALERLIPS